ncbi:MAG: hypothetical protein R2839_12155 [Thermomicrobiales bacterium]
MDTAQRSRLSAPGHGFRPGSAADLFTFPELRHTEIALMDIDADRLRDSEIVANRLAMQLDASPSIPPPPPTERALDRADYVLNMIQVGGYEPATPSLISRFKAIRTPADDRRYLESGGIMRALLRTIPVMLDIALDIEAVAPDALLLNYTNPWQCSPAPCLWRPVSPPSDSVTACSEPPRSSLWRTRTACRGNAYLCAGINHMAFYLTFEHQGRDLYPDLMAVAASRREPPHERVRFEVLRRFGYFVTESNPEQFQRVCSWFIKPDRPELIDQFNIPLDEYPARCAGTDRRLE